MAHIELIGIQKRWGEIFGVRDINIDIADEEFLVLLGPSGCGKTTTMRMIAGLEDPSEGEVHIDGELMNDIDARDRDTAMVFQSYALYPNMTVYENIRFPLRMCGVAKSDQDRQIRAAADKVELGDLLDRKTSGLSGGQRQRAALARAIVRQPKVFLMDEPLSNLDAKLRQSMRVQIKHLQRELKVTTVYVTHDQIEAMTLADRIVIMDGGLVQQIGTSSEIYAAPANSFVASFIGSPPMNLIPSRVENGVFSTDGVSVDDLPIECIGAVTLGVRPEDCSVTAASEHHLSGDVYGVEPTGDVTYLSVARGDHMIEVKAACDYRSDLGVTEHIAFDRNHLHFFDTESGDRLL